MQRINKQSGFTLLEMIVYIGVFSLLIVIVVTFFISTITAREKHRVISEVELEGAQAMQQITQAVRNASSITAPVTGGSSSTSLTVATATTATNPTIIDLASGALGIKEGTGARVPLTTNSVTVSALTFRNLTRTSTAGIVKIQFTVTYTTTSAKQQFQYAKTFYGSAAPRRIF